MSGERTALPNRPEPQVAMSPAAYPLVIGLGIAVLAWLASSLATVAGHLTAGPRRDRLLRLAAARRRRPVPFGWPSVALAVLVMLGAGEAVVLSYEAVRQTYHVRVGPPPKPVEKKSEAVEKPKHNGKSNVPRPSPPAQGEAAGADTGERFTFTEKLFLSAVHNALSILLIPLLLRLSSGTRLRDLGLTASHLGRNVWLGLTAFVTLTPCVLAVNLLAVLVWRGHNRHPLEQMLRQGLTPMVVVLAYVSAVVLAPLAEEILFRGVLQGWFFRLDARGDLISEAPGRRKSLSPSRFWLPIASTSLVFSMMHAPQMPAPVALFFLSLALGWLREVSASLVPSVVLHAAFNAFNTTIMVVSLSAPAPNQELMRKIEGPPQQAENAVATGGFSLALAKPAAKFW